MNKCLIVGIVVFSLILTTASANHFENEQIIYYQNCPYDDETTSIHNCPNNRYHYNNSKGNGYGKHGRYFRYNK